MAIKYCHQYRISKTKSSDTEHISKDGCFLNLDYRAFHDIPFYKDEIQVGSSSVYSM